MKKIVLNISDCTYEKLRLESLEENKDIGQIIYERFFHKSFSEDVENYFEEWIGTELEKIMKE